MSNPAERETDDRYEAENDPSPVSGNVVDDSFTRETRSELRAPDQMPVIPDEEGYDDPMQPPYANTNEQLGIYILSSHKYSLAVLIHTTQRRMTGRLLTRTIFFRGIGCGMRSHRLAIGITRGLMKISCPRMFGRAMMDILGSRD